MIKQPRNEKGKFVLKGEEERKVRTVRLTDSTWNKLGEMAKQRCITRTELIEELLEQNNDEVIRILKEALTLKANAGGAIKEKIRQALLLL
ncbi:hypothetical protein [Chroococcus sp. FPU101]|uniref:hypothetical protein n=1 Tax=Chroococcus sp. FPU101 TaxID=1974212 RepID=UPI001A8DD322|nr:hypothetical protein [Chroococcus sp. FPU101]GFE72305.1 hypothetical protein CFPU101_49150 [Chroococcus sp. FPU101]